MLSQVPLYLDFASDRIVIEDYPEALDVEWQHGVSAGQKDCRLPQGVGVTEFVKDVGVDRGYIRDDDLGLLYLSLNVLKYYAGPGFFVDTNDIESRSLRLALDYFLVERIVGFGELHHNKCPGPAARSSEIGKRHFVIPGRYQTDLRAFERTRNKVTHYGDIVYR